MNGLTLADGTLRKPLLALLGLGLAGTGAELLLLGHFEDVWQLVPLALVVLSLLVIAWYVAAPGPRSLGGLRSVMLLLVASGPLGLWLHYRGNAEFELETMPGLTGLALFREAMTGATPALAPGAMTLLGLIGLIYGMGGRRETRGRRERRGAGS